MIKIKADILRNFVNKTLAGGLIEDSKLVFSENGLKMSHKDAEGVVLIAGLLDKSNFAEYEACSFTVKDSKNFLSALRTFKDNMLNIKIENNMVKIMDENGGFDLTQAEAIKCFVENAPTLEYAGQILLKKSIVDSIIEKSSIVKSDEVAVNNTTDKKIIFSVGKESDKATSECLSSLDVSQNTVFDLSYFKSLASQFDPVFDLSIGTDGKPSKFEEKTDKYHIIYYLTPITESN